MINFNEELKCAMKAHDEVKKTVLRNIKAAKLNFESQPGRPEYTEAAEVGILKKMAKQLEDSMTAFREGSREDLWEESNSQLEVLKSYIPAGPKEEDILAEVKKFFENYERPYPKNLMGMCIKEVKSSLTGVDGRLLSEVVKNWMA